MLPARRPSGSAYKPRANLLPGTIVQALMLGIVAAYYCLPGVRGVLDQIGAVKKAVGLPFSSAICVLGGAVLPELLKVACFQRMRMNRANLRALGITALLWVWAGALADLLYRGQALMFGNGTDFATIAAKVAVDQFVYNPLFGAILNTVAYDLLARGFTWANLRGCGTWSYYQDRVLPTLVATWGAWIPLTAIIYSLPGNLQIPLFGLALAFWALMLAYINAPRPQPATSSGPKTEAVGAAS